MSDLDGSSTKGNTPGAARAPGPSYLRVYRPEVNIQRQVHGIILQTAPGFTGGSFLFMGEQGEIANHWSGRQGYHKMHENWAQ